MKLINMNLFTPENIVAIGAIVFFWACVSYFLREVFAMDQPPVIDG